MNPETNDDKAARAQLDRAAAELDDLTVARLRAGRKRALAAAGRKPLHLLSWLPLSAAAAVLVAITATALWWRAPEPGMTITDELELSLTRDDPEFFTDLEFYNWIRQEQEAG
jgi:hypothetical protein